MRKNNEWRVFSLFVFSALGDVAIDNPGNTFAGCAIPAARNNSVKSCCMAATLSGVACQCGVLSELI